MAHVFSGFMCNLPVNLLFFCAGVFAFDLYDLNADGKLTSAEVAQMFRELMGAKTLEQEAISR